MNQPGITRLSSWLRLVLGLGLLIGLLAVTGGLARPAHAATSITVSTCDEAHLDAAVAQANSDNAGDTITFTCSGYIVLTSTLTISGNMTLDGSGQQVTLDGNNGINRVQVFFVNSGVSFTLNALTVAYGKADNGGGLFNNGGTVSITNSTFAYNEANLGGGGGLVNNGGTVSITNSTFAYNEAIGGGGGLLTGPGFSSKLSITNSTFANNSVIGSGNGGGLAYDGGTVSIGGSIVANNSATSGSNCSHGLPITDQGYNLESGTDCGFTGTGSLQNTDPKLDPNGLQSNGGPTQTIALLSTSPAIDAIPVSTTLCPSTDQRGVIRPDDNEASCDIGAYESNYAPADNDLSLTHLPANITTNASSAQGAVVTYTPPTVVDEDSPLPTASCSPASSSTFAIGTTTVTCSVSDSDDTNSSVSASFTVTVTPVLTASETNISATEGKSFSGVVATGADYGAGTLSASIDWGDGQSSNGTVTLATTGSYSVTGRHVYDEEGSFAITVTVSGSGVPTASASSSATVSDAALTANTPTAAIQKLAVTTSMVFFDADPNGAASDYSATITWGDGSSSTATISANSTSFTATGSHSYAKHAKYTVTVTIKDAGGSSVTKMLTIKV